MIRQLKNSKTAEGKLEIQAQVRTTVETILADILARGDAAVLDYSKKFDHWSTSDRIFLNSRGPQHRHEPECQPVWFPLSCVPGPEFPVCLRPSSNSSAVGSWLAPAVIDLAIISPISEAVRNCQLSYTMALGRAIGFAQSLVCEVSARIKSPPPTSPARNSALAHENFSTTGRRSIAVLI